MEALAARKRRPPKPPEPAEARKVAFICRKCGQAVGDPQYCGPWGHAPQDVCFECWLEAFEQPPWHWPREVLAVWLIANGFSRTEAAAICGVTAPTVWRWLRYFRKKTEKFLDLMQGLEGLCTLRRLRRGKAR